MIGVDGESFLEHRVPSNARSALAFGRVNASRVSNPYSSDGNLKTQPRGIRFRGGVLFPKTSAINTSWVSPACILFFRVKNLGWQGLPCIWLVPTLMWNHMCPAHLIHESRTYHIYWGGRFLTRLISDGFLLLSMHISSLANNVCIFPG